jgi:outer membrane receptor protein involved in Fe transport
MIRSTALGTRHRAIRALTGVLTALAAMAPSLARGQGSCSTRAPAGPVTTTYPAWPPPLDRFVAFHARDISLRDALGHLAMAARVRLAYSSELLPLDRRVCFSRNVVSVGDALIELLRGTAVEPRVVGPDHVAIVPVLVSEGTVAAADNAVHLPRAAAVLDRVVVTGTATGGAQRSLPVGVHVISGAQLERYTSDGTLARALSSAVPGIWIWEQSPSSLIARYGSIRGASSFGVSYPKVYVDGIEVANPLLVTQINPSMVERVEVIRGPQGAALYGTDAISGVINIVTRTDGVTNGASRFQFRSDAGVAESDFASGASLTQRHELTMRAGSSFRSASLGITAGTAGAFVPEAYSRQLTVTGGARFLGSRSIVTTTGRFVAHRAASSVSPLIIDSVPESTTMSPGRPPRVFTNQQSVWQYTLGTSARFMPGGRWTHAATVGVDGYRLTDVADEVRAIPLAVDSGLQSVRGVADRGTMRLSSIASFGSEDHTSGTLTLAAEQSILREGTNSDDGFGLPRPGDGKYDQAPYSVSWRSNTGLVAQTHLAFNQALYLTGGMRIERNDGFVAMDQVTTLPMFGAAVIRDRGDVTVKLRAAYGKGIRPQRMPVRETVWVSAPGQSLSAMLAPEQQSGIEAGVELLVGRALTFQATRFDQLASGLIQRVPTRAQTDPSAGPGRRHVTYALRNVGEITNRGWELAGTAAFGRLSLNGTMSLVDSRVRRLAMGYIGDLRPGDRTLEVPSRTTSFTASWSGARSFGSLTVLRAADWVNYDRLALAWAAVNYDPPSDDQMGPWLRGFWRTYDGVTRLRLTTSRELRRGVALVLTGENLLDRQLGEPDNVTILPGRTITLGIKAAF